MELCSDPELIKKGCTCTQRKITKLVIDLETGPRKRENLYFDCRF